MCTCREDQPVTTYACDPTHRQLVAVWLLGTGYPLRSSPPSSPPLMIEMMPEGWRSCGRAAPAAVFAESDNINNATVPNIFPTVVYLDNWPASARATTPPAARADQETSARLGGPYGPRLTEVPGAKKSNTSTNRSTGD